MKLHRLELIGFGPFRDTQVVDFDAFDDDGLFLISGRTGTGKSSILDGVSFALYGTVPRYEGGEKRLRSDHAHPADPTEVRLEFTVGARRWRVTRAPEYDRPAKRGGGLTTAPARAELDELVDGVWVGRAAKPRTVGEALGEVLGLNAAQFQQVILLAQNKFSRFLLAPGDERQTLLRTLFGTRRFERYRDDLEQRRRDAADALKAVDGRARTLLGEAERLIGAHGLEPADGATAADAPLPERRAAAERALQRAQYRVEQADLARRGADAASEAAAAAHAALQARAERGRERAALRERLSGLEERSAAVDADRRRLADARAAALLRAPGDAAERADRAAATAAADAAAARRRWTDGGGDADADVAALVDTLTGDLVRWEAAAAHERELDERAAAHVETTRVVADLRAACDALDERRAGVPAARAALDEQIVRAEAGAARRDELDAERARLGDVLDAARRAEAHADALTRAETAYARASAATEAAAAEVGALLRRRLAGAAGELAAALVPGEPCAVCGSTAHPRPAHRGDEPVTDEVLAAAERARDAAVAAEGVAREAAAHVRDELAQARAEAAGLEVASAEEQLASAAAAAAAAAQAAALLDELHARRRELDATAALAETERARVADDLAAARERLRGLESDIARLTAAVVEGRGGFDSVAARIAATAAERDRARAVVTAAAARDERLRVRDAAMADFETRLASSPFADAAAVRAALLDDAGIAQLDAEVADHAARLAATRARLLELELDAVGDEIDAEALARSAQAAAAADAARAEAIAAHTGADGVAARLDDLLRQVDAALVAVQESGEDAAAVIRLADTVAGRAPNTMKMDLETFVLAAELEEIVAAANVRLAEMSSGRYTLHHSDARAARGRASGLGIDVLDAHTGRLRSPQSLSGGETFLASLALALGLGEVVTSRAGGIRLDTLFVDEGFGSLDPETLELAMRTLDDLRAGGRTVGVISHVEAMKEQLPAQILVTSTHEGPSVIRQDAARPSAESAREAR
ncbi:SMC family ATPase [Microbacterium hominis]|uniref:AAA family ATPase n=1 Tax=Microbacterium hominis TaxID=162426 RepID=UPI0019661FDC|nr:SMC family ATPase [Microbacterium hominis]QRY40180.1 SMC family ATPase [Microbacterium hominis]